MVRSENFSDIIAMIVADDKQGVITFLRGQGIAVSPTADVQEVVRSLFASFKSDKFRQKFVSWADNKYKSTANFSNANGFDPMDAQNGGAEVNFSTTPQAPADLGLQINRTVSQVNTTSTPKQTTAVGDAIRDLGGIGGIINTGIGIWQTQEQNEQQQELINAQIKAKELELQALVEQGKISSQAMQQQLALLRAQKEAPKSQTLLYVIGGVVLLAGIGTAIYFATRKK